MINMCIDNWKTFFHRFCDVPCEFCSLGIPFKDWNTLTQSFAFLVSTLTSHQIRNHFWSRCHFFFEVAFEIAITKSKSVWNRSQKKSRFEIEIAIEITFFLKSHSKSQSQNRNRFEVEITRNHNLKSKSLSKSPFF